MLSRVRGTLSVVFQGEREIPEPGPVAGMKAPRDSPKPGAVEAVAWLAIVLFHCVALAREKDRRQSMIVGYQSMMAVRWPL